MSWNNMKNYIPVNAYESKIFFLEKSRTHWYLLALGKINDIGRLNTLELKE